MHFKKQKFSNFSRNMKVESKGLRPDNEEQLAECFESEADYGFLARGRGLSYNDCCLNSQGYTIESQRLNHFQSFDSNTALLVCQGNVSFSDLFRLHPDFIPAVIPGTAHASLAGGIANDVHGKNNPHVGSFGDQIDWFSLQTGQEIRRCSREENADLFHATIGGLGLTGVIRRIGLKLCHASRFVSVNTTSFTRLPSLIHQMDSSKQTVDYQAAWLDLLNNPRAILFQAMYTDLSCKPSIRSFTVPRLPSRLIYHWTMKQFNKWYYQSKSNASCLPLIEFNNPLDRMQHWNRLYGRKGLIQFQGVFAKESAVQTLEQLLEIIKRYKATPTLAVLKVFNRSGSGLLSFCQPGFTIAIDFINNKQAHHAIKAMNQYLCEIGGKIYLAKDLLLNPEQFRQMYPRHEEFSHILQSYQSPMQSDLARRLEIIQ